MSFRGFAKFYLGILLIVLIMTSFKSLQVYNVLHSDQVFQKPNSMFWFGTDSLGRDLFSRMIVGGIISIIIGFTGAIGSLILALLIGTILGWSENSVDRWGMKLLNVYHSVPSFIIASVLCLGLQNVFSTLSANVTSFLSLNLALIFTHWSNSARLIRAELKRMKTENYMTATKSLGASDFQVLRMHLALYLKNKLAIIFGFIFPSVLFYESFLSFVGFGIQAPLTSWGLLIQEGWRSMGTYPHLIFIPMFFVVLTVWSVNIIVIDADQI